MIMKEEFDYDKAVEELETIAAKVEDPKTALGDIEKYVIPSLRGEPVTDSKYGAMKRYLELQMMALAFATRPLSSLWESSM